MRSFVLCASRSALLLAAVCGIASVAAAQGAVGSGPLTSMLPATEPQSGVIRAGALRIVPGLTIREIGHDDNVFNETFNPKEDWVVAGTPDVVVFTRLPLAQIAGYAGSDMQWYHTYESQRSVGYMYRGRIDLLFSRIFPFVGGGRTQGRTRPNGEIDVRAEHATDELSGGVGYSLSEHASVFGSWIESSIDYEDGVQSGVDLQQSLNHKSTEYRVGMKTDLTPLLSMQLRGAVRKDDFDVDESRNGETREFTAEFGFDPAAFISGIASIRFEDYKPDDPTVNPFRGITGDGLLKIPFLDIGHFNFGYNRSTEYSFDTASAYYLETTFRGVYTQRLVGELDLQGQAAHSTLDYRESERGVARKDTLETYNGNLGYNLRNQTRIAMNYEYARRRSPVIVERNYIRRRIYLSWMVAF